MKKNIFIAALFLLIFGFAFSQAVFPFGMERQPAVALADDDDDDEEERDDDDDEERDDDDDEVPVPDPTPASAPAPVVEKVQVEKKAEPKPEAVPTFVTLPDQIIEEQILTTIYDSDGDGVFDPDDATPNVHNIFVVEDNNFNGIADTYENGE